MTHHSVFRKELLKLYTICEVAQKVLDTTPTDYLDASGKYTLNLFMALNSADIDTTILALDMVQMKPKQLDDSTVNFILNSFKDINSENAKNSVKNTLFYVCLNNLINHKLASIQNVLSLNPYELNSALVETYNATRDIKIRVAKQLESVNEHSMEKATL